ncbi:MAG: 50S ribosomal protein L10 [Candidatus Diapherotrites archaeon]|nr:50S ribosomal protein L10 [Candidatus Diapherotrites archaeon]
MRRAILEKQKQVEELKDRLSKHKTVMIANIEGVPAPMMQKLRKMLKQKALLKVYKNTVIIRALKGLKDETLEKLADFVEGHPSAIILTDEDPVKMYREISSVVEYAPLRPGKPAPEDIVLQPGPVPVPITMLSEIKAAGIPVKSVKGSVQLDKEYVVVRKGEIVDERVARALEIMGIKPVKVYLRVVAAVHDNLLFTEDVLSITPEDVLEWVKEAAAHAFNLAYNARYPTKQTVPFFLAEAHQRALNLAINAGIVTKETAPAILSKAYAQALALASRLPPEALDEKTRALVGAVAQPSAEEKKEEEPKEEEKEEEGGEEEAAAGLASLFG